MKSDKFTEGERNILSDTINKLDRELKAKEFIIEQLNRNSELSEKYLNTSISDLENANQEISRINQILLERNKIIDENFHQLENAYKELEEFTYIASHDLKSPLQNILNFVNLLKESENGNITSEGNTFINFIHESAVRMNETLVDTLEYSKIDKSNINASETDFEEVIEIVKKNLHKQIQESKATIVTNALPNFPAFKTSIIQLFQNLIANSINYCRPDVPPIIYVGSSKIENGWSFQVVDNGKGIESEFQHKIFKAFQRLESGTSGTGIGLAICMKVVKMHKGNIRYQPNPKGGSIFSFELKPIS